MSIQSRTGLMLKRAVTRQDRGIVATSLSHLVMSSLVMLTRNQEKRSLSATQQARISDSVPHRLSPESSTRRISLQRRRKRFGLHLLVNRLPFALKAGNRSGYAVLVGATIKHTIPRATEWVPLPRWFAGKNGGLCEEQLGFFLLNVNHIDPTTGQCLTYQIRRSSTAHLNQLCTVIPDS